MDFSGASVNMASGLSAADEQPSSIHVEASAASFESDLQAAQLVFAVEGLGTSLSDVPLDDLGTSDILDDPSPTEQMMWLGVTLPLPIELHPCDTAAGADDDSLPLVSNKSTPISRAELTNLIEVGLTPVVEPCEELIADPRFESNDANTADLPTLNRELRYARETTSPEINSSFLTMEEGLLADSSLDDVRLPMGNQTLAYPTADEELKSFDAPVADVSSTITVDRSVGIVSVQMIEVQTNIPLAETQSSHSSGSGPVEPRKELSEVVRQVRTMVTEHETRSTIQLEPAQLGRLTVELVEAPEGLRATLFAEDPAVQRFLERNVQLLETEARLQGVGHMSFSVGANMSGGLGHSDQRQSEAEESFRKNIEWNTHKPVTPRSRRELDTSA